MPELTGLVTTHTLDMQEREERAQQELEAMTGQLATVREHRRMLEALLAPDGFASGPPGGASSISGNNGSADVASFSPHLAAQPWYRVLYTAQVVAHPAKCWLTGCHGIT